MKKVILLIITFFMTFMLCAYAASPKLLLEKAGTNPETVTPGEKFELKLSLNNISEDEAKDVIVRIVGIEGKNALGDFSPVGSSTEIYGDSIAKKSKKELSIGLIVNSSIKSGLYNLVLNISYKDKNKKIYESNQVVGVIVKNKPVLRITSLDYPKTAVKGSSAKIKLSLINAGKGTLDGIMVNLNNFPVSEKIRYIGKLDPGDTDDYEFEVKVEGDINGNIDIVYVDEFNIENKISQNVTIAASGDNTVSQKDSRGFWSSAVRFFKRLFGLGD